MDPQVFAFSNYKNYLRELASHRPRGFRKALAAAARCQTAYVTHVLNGSGHFNLEQAELAGRFIGFASDELRYFVLLVAQNRAGTEELRNLFSGPLKELQDRQGLLKKRIDIHETLNAENRATYYSSWHYSAVHMAVTIPRLRSRPALQQALKMGPKKLREVLDFLVACGLIARNRNEFIPGPTLLHLEKGEPGAYQHHVNWHAKALASVHDENDPAALHYSSVVTLSASDAKKIRSIIARDIGQWIKTVKASREEQVHGLVLDFFRVDSAIESGN